MHIFNFFLFLQNVINYASSHYLYVVPREFLNFKVGSRCEVEPGEKRGVVKFVGQAEALGPGLWVGIQYDEPLGKHDGM